MFKYLQHLLLSLILLVGISTANSLQAQGQYGNEWINYSQTYHKLKVTNTGLHRLSYGYLDSLGLAGVNPKQLQLFRRGKEVAIYVAGQADGRLDAHDFVEFYGERNNGALDAELYKNPTNQVHQFHSLYTDTAAYFLTYASTLGKRMQEINPAISGKTPEPYHLQKALTVNTDRFNYGKIYDEVNRTVHMPWMDEGEGYMSNFSINPRNYSIGGISNVALSGPKPVLKFATVGAFPESHKLDVNVLIPGGGSRKLATYTYGYFEKFIDKKEIGFNELNANGTVTIQIVPAPSTTNGNAISFSFGELTYPQTSVFSGNQVIYYTDSTRSVNPYYEFKNAPASAVSYDITDPTNVIRILGYSVSGGKGFVISENSRTRKILIANTVKPFKPVKRVKDLKLRQIDPAAYNYIILTNKRLMQPAGGVNTPAPVQYAAYRASQAGGGYDTLTMQMDQVVDQFHYGEFSSNSIRRFMSFMNSSARPKHLFIIGKGVKYASNDYLTLHGNKYSYYHVGARKPDIHSIDLVPTGAFPSSDIFFTADFRNNSYTPTVPTGRLAATTAEEVVSYLNKVKEYEAVPEGQPWQKNVLQLGGGTTPSEIKRIASYLTSLKRVIEGSLLGANVIEKYRENVSQAVETINVSDEVNNGLSIMTFYGHSASSTNDLDIGLVSMPVNGYNNKGKYPFMLMFGCNTGDAFYPGKRSFGEDWLLTPDKGAIAFMAQVEGGYPTALEPYGMYLYSWAYEDPEYYGETLGKIQQKVIERLSYNSNTNSSTKDGILIAAVTQVILQADPAVRLYSPSKPDYLIQQNGLSVRGNNNQIVTSDSETFNLAVKVDNLGKAITDSLTVSVKRVLADNTAIVYDPVKVGSITRAGEILVPVKNDGINALGLNTFELKLDSPNEFDELNESNNTASFQHFFPVNGLFTLTPAEFGIVNSNNVTLTAQATKLNENRDGYIFEIDTTHTFKSGFKKSFTAGNELLPSINVNLSTLGNFADSTVYFWRVRFKNYPAGEDTVWATSSFRYINGTHKGWSQSHPGQFAKSRTERLVVESSKPYFNFLPQKSEIIIKTKGGTGFNIPPHGLFVDGKQQIESFPCSDPWTKGVPRLYMVVINDKTLKQVKGLSGAVICPAYPEIYEFGDLNVATNRARVETFIKGIPAGYHVAVVSVKNVPFESFTPSQKEAFRTLGSSLIDNLKNGSPFVLVGRKGSAAGTAQELSDTDLNKDISLRVELASKQSSGTITSTDIGPALNWSKLHHTIRKNKAGEDAYKLSVIGKSFQGDTVTLIKNVSSKEMNLSSINAKEYPYLQLRAELSDPTNRTAPQLEEWMVFYTEAPEGVIRPDMVTNSGPPLSEQANYGGIKVPMVFQNISTIAFPDSIEVEITVTGEGIKAGDYNPILKLKPLEAKSHVDFEFAMPTVKLSGNYLLRINVNPRKQPEQHYFNNIYEVQFEVDRKLHPVMDVAFDGVHIMDGELVSPSPVISIIVKDQNKHTFLQTPEGLSMRLEAGNLSKEIQLLNNPEEVKFFPADANNDFRLEYTPKEKLEDGMYTLEVNAKDVVGKSAGISPYRISFEVENESTITNFYPYPNPFSTKTQFIFTLTGATIPDNMKIQIMTVTGKVVKEIMKDEIGPVRVGNNKTAYAWDGTDTFGDKLANGVYLYRVVLSQNAADIKHKNKVSDKAFNNGYGKLYILR